MATSYRRSAAESQNTRQFGAIHRLVCRFSSTSTSTSTRWRNRVKPADCRVSLRRNVRPGISTTPASGGCEPSEMSALLMFNSTCCSRWAYAAPLAFSDSPRTSMMILTRTSYSPNQQRYLRFRVFRVFRGSPTSPFHPWGSVFIRG